MSTATRKRGHASTTESPVVSSTTPPTEDLPVPVSVSSSSTIQPLAPVSSSLSDIPALPEVTNSTTSDLNDPKNAAGKTRATKKQKKEDEKDGETNGQMGAGDAAHAVNTNSSSSVSALSVTPAVGVQPVTDPESIITQLLSDHESDADPVTGLTRRDLRRLVIRYALKAQNKSGSARNYRRALQQVAVSSALAGGAPVMISEHKKTPPAETIEQLEESSHKRASEMNISRQTHSRWLRRYNWLITKGAIVHGQKGKLSEVINALSPELQAEFRRVGQMQIKKEEDQSQTNPALAAPGANTAAPIVKQQQQ